MRNLTLYDDYSRKEVHEIFDPESQFTAQAGTWGLQGIIEIPERAGDYVFFVTFGQKQGAHEFDEGITTDGVLRWQSQPKQALDDPIIKKLIGHNEDRNSIYLFLRTAARRGGTPVPYTYLGRLKYRFHDRDRQRPVYFTWQVLDWPLPEVVRERMHLTYDTAAGADSAETHDRFSLGGLVHVPPPKGSERRTGVSSGTYLKRPHRDRGEEDAKNRQLGLAGENAVLESERMALLAAGRADLAERIRHISKIEGDGAGYDIESYTPEGEKKFIEVKTTRGDEHTAFYISANELRFGTEHDDRYYLYRVFEFDERTYAGRMFVLKGDPRAAFCLTAVQFKAVPGA